MAYLNEGVEPGEHGLQLQLLWRPLHGGGGGELRQGAADVVLHARGRLKRHLLHSHGVTVRELLAHGLALRSA